MNQPQSNSHAHAGSTWLACAAIACALHGGCVLYFAAHRAHVADARELKELKVT